jgi:SAM-dependent methyltransferase
VREWTAKRDLEPPERTLLASLAPALGTMRMLDIGVGGGRTTVHLAPMVREYVGIDYARPLIEACRARFVAWPRCRFHHGDARSMPMFDDASFDLVLFSVNGIDCLDHDGRMAALAEIARVCRPGGRFFFSSHNLCALARARSLRAEVRQLWATRTPARFPVAVAKRVPHHVLVGLANPPAVEQVDRAWTWVSEGWPPRSPCGTYHVAPEEARRQLEAVGFALERMVLPSGAEAGFDDCVGLGEDLWLNYLCRRRGDQPREPGP